MSGSEISRLELAELLKFFELPSSLVNTTISLALLSLQKGLAEIWAQVVSGIGLIYYELFLRPGPLCRVGYPF